MGDFPDGLALGEFRDGAGAADIDELPALLVGQTELDDILCALHIHVHDLFVIVRVYGDDAGTVNHDALHPPGDGEEPGQGVQVTQIPFALGYIPGDIPGCGVPREHQRPHLLTPVEELAAYGAAQETGGASHQINSLFCIHQTYLPF